MISIIIGSQAAASARMLEDIAPPGRPAKLRRLEPAFGPPVRGQPGLLHELSGCSGEMPAHDWPGWLEVAAALGLNREHGPALVREATQLHHEPRKLFARPPSERPAVMPSMAAPLQRLTVLLRLAQASADLCCLC